MIRPMQDKHRKLLVIAILIIFFIIYLLRCQDELDWSPEVPGIFCHYVNDGDAIQSAEENFSPPVKSIFFHETSCKGGLNARQACAVESAARAHPRWQINVMFSAPVNIFTLFGNLRHLQTYKNVKFIRVHILKYGKGTPLEALLASDKLNKSDYQIIHTADVLRLLTLYKWDGIYLDLDVIVAKSLEYLGPNWSARESEHSVSVGAFAFSRDPLGRKIADSTVRHLNATFRGDNWSFNGPGLITRVLRSMCSETDVTKMSAATCEGFEVYGPESFYPISWEMARSYCEVGDIMNSTNTFGYHVFNHINEDCEIKRNSRYAILAEKYCPMTYKTYITEFGS